MLHVGSVAAVAFDEETLQLALSILGDIVESEQSAVVNPHLATAVAFALDAATCTKLETESRTAALNLVALSLTHKRKLLVKQKLVPPIAQRLFEACCADDDNEDDDDGGGDGEISVHKRAARTLHTMATHVPSKHALPAVLEQVKLHWDSSLPYRRRAALVLLAVTAEGCQEAMAAQLPSLLPVVYAGCADAEQVVREAACITIGQFAQYLQPEIISHYKEVLPHIFTVSRSPRRPPRPDQPDPPCAALYRPRRSR